MATAPPPPQPYPAVAPPIAPPPTPRKGLSKGTGVAIAAVVVVVVVVLALLLSGAIPGLKNSSNGGGSTSPGGSGSDLTYGQASPIAASAMASRASSAILVLGFGLDTVSPYTNSTLGPGGSACVPSGGSTTTLTVPTFTGNYHSGVAPAWIFGFYANVGGGAVYLMGVINGAAVYFGSESESSCTGGGELGNLTIPTGTIDSSAAATAVAADAASFTTANPTANAFYWLFGSITYSSGPPLNYTFTEPATWNVFYSTCSPSQVSGTGTQFNATVNAVTSAVMGYDTQTVNCTGYIGEEDPGSAQGGLGVTFSQVHVPMMNLRGS